MSIDITTFRVYNTITRSNKTDHNNSNRLSRKRSQINFLVPVRERRVPIATQKKLRLQLNKRKRRKAYVYDFRRDEQNDGRN